MGAPLSRLAFLVYFFLLAKRAHSYLFRKVRSIQIDSVSPHFLMSASFESTLLRRTGPPQGDLPRLAPFARDVEDNSNLRFNVEAARKNVKAIFEGLPGMFPSAYRKQWKVFFDKFPATPKNVPKARRFTFKINQIPPCAMRLPSGAGLQNHVVSTLLAFLRAISFHTRLCMTAPV